MKSLRYLKRDKKNDLLKNLILAKNFNNGINNCLNYYDMHHEFINLWHALKSLIKVARFLDYIKILMNHKNAYKYILYTYDFILKYCYWFGRCVERYYSSKGFHVKIHRFYF